MQSKHAHLPIALVLPKVGRVVYTAKPDSASSTSLSFQ